MEHTFYKMTFGKSIFCDFSVLTESSILVKCKSYVRDSSGRVEWTVVSGLLAPPGHTLSGGQPLVLSGISHKLNS